MKAGHIYIGTSGWSYKSWAEAFYPADLPPGKQLTYYTTKFPTVEVNRTFYSLPTEKALCDWKRTAPAGFLYSLKGSRAVTHFKRLRPGAKSLSLLLDRSKSLGGRRGPVLWQLPGTLKKDLPRLAISYERCKDLNFATPSSSAIHRGWTKKSSGSFGNMASRTRQSAQRKCPGAWR